MTGPDSILVSTCPGCHGRFLPRPGPCPRCGSTVVRPQPIPSVGEVLAATELTVPPAGWPEPHRLALVELSHGVRVLCLVAGDLPPIASRVRVVRDGERYLASLEPS